MRKVESVLEPIIESVSLEGKSVVDVGCGNGDVARALSEHGARVIGVDRPEKLAKARVEEDLRGVRFVEGRAERLPVGDASADVVLFLASFHHVPPIEIQNALSEAFRVLSPGGAALFIEPLIECSYYLITRLVEDETDARQGAHEAITNAVTAGFEAESEDFFSIERSFGDYRDLLEVHWEESEELKAEVLARAEVIARKLAAGAGCAFEEYRFESSCRMNLVRKPTEGSR